MCEGDSVSSYNSEAQCYRLEGCSGCDKCIIRCSPPCENCPSWAGTKARNPEPGDYVVVQTPILTEAYKGPKWSPAMDLAIGRVGWVAKGNPVEGFSLKFQTTSKEILDQFKYPLEALRLAFPADRSIDKMIKTTKEGSPNEEM
jgi:hypothetical protein